jgi:hypothetical protein
MLEASRRRYAHREEADIELELEAATVTAVDEQLFKEPWLPRPEQRNHR